MPVPCLLEVAEYINFLYYTLYNAKLGICHRIRVAMRSSDDIGAPRRTSTPFSMSSLPDAVAVSPALSDHSSYCLPEDSPLYVPDPLKPIGALCLAGPTDLRAIVEPAQTVCGANVIQRLIGGEPEDVPGRFGQTSPTEMLPIGVRQIVIHGSDDPVVPPAAGQAYVAAGESSGESIGLIIIPNAAHFEVIAPWTYSWPIIEASVLSLLTVEDE